MIYKILDKSDYKDFVSALIENYDLIGPKKADKAVSDFVPIKNFEELDTDYKKTTLSPAKKILFKSNEDLISYELGDKIEVKPLVESKEQILFGINAWDINGMNFMDKIFTTDYEDENYIAKRKKLAVIGMDTEPSESNFANVVGSEYAKDGFDLYMHDLGEKFFVRVNTACGEELLEKYANTTEASKEDFAEFDKYLQDYRSKFKVDVDLENFYDDFEIAYNDDELFEKLSEKCFSCGTCNLVCPTCFCFNVKDDMQLNLKIGIKSREWDGCMIPEYGLVAGGHNFRSTKANRLKQRYRCKLKTFVDKFGTYACVGCGRCVDGCLAKINIYEDINSIKKEVSI